MPSADMDDSELAEAVSFLFLVFHILKYGHAARKTCWIDQVRSSNRFLFLQVLTLLLNSLGNTCYMNATVQALRAVPELQVALDTPSLQSTTPLPAALRDLYHRMSRTTDSITPMQFLQVLRQVCFIFVSFEQLLMINLNLR
jgi:ubiquitin C-terminal hydrolase